MLSSEAKRLTGVLESCRERFGKTVQEQFEKRKADKNARKTKKQKNELNPSLFNTRGFLLYYIFFMIQCYLLFRYCWIS